jgi:fibronectin type 3 domain-containing protein
VEPGPSALDPREFALAGKKVLTLATADIGAATLGDKVVLMLPIAEAEAGVTVRHFQIRTVGPLGDRSEPSNTTRIVPRTPPTPPVEIVATPKATGIDLSWKPAEGALGYLVYRRDAAVKNYGKPLQAVVAPAVSMTDATAQLGASYIYAVTTVSHRAPLVESAIQSEREVRYADRYPPPPVTELVALAEQGQVRLIWTGSDAPDLAGYRIYRREGGDLRRLNVEPVATTEFTDTSVASGRTYVYRVVAIDKTGNESTPQEVPATTR